MIPAAVTWDCTEAHQFVERPAYAEATEAGPATQNQLTGGTSPGRPDRPNSLI